MEGKQISMRLPTYKENFSPKELFYITEYTDGKFVVGFFNMTAFEELMKYGIIFSPNEVKTWLEDVQVNWHEIDALIQQYEYLLGKYLE